MTSKLRRGIDKGIDRGIDRGIGWKLLLTVVLLIGVLACAPAGAASADADPALGGSWRLDRERSDDARDDLQSALRDLAADLRPPAQNRNRPTVLSRRTPRGDLSRDLFGAVHLAQEEVRIELTDADVAFRLDDRPEERIWTDGRPSIVDADNPGVRLGAWEDRVLWIERSSDRGTRVIESWRREGADLVADYEVRNGLLEEPIEFTLVFVSGTRETPAP